MPITFALTKVLSIKKQLMLMFFAFFSLIFIALAFVQDYAVSHHLSQQDYNYLSNKFNTLTAEEKQQPEYLLSLLADEPIYLWLLKQGQVINTNTSLPLPLSVSSAKANVNNKVAFEWQVDELHVSAYRFAVDQQYAVVMGLKVNHHIQFLAEMRTILFGTLGVAFLLLSIYSIVIINKGLRPLSKFNHHIRTISPDRLGLRICTDTLPKEVQTLVTTHNQMLDRIEEGFERLRDFSSDIAHELRTPLTNIITQNQVMLSGKRNTQEYKETIESNLEELHRIVKTINDVLYIAKAENALIRRDDERLNVAEQVDQIAEYYSILSEERNIAIEVKGAAHLNIDKNMLQRAVTNLVANAVRHADSDSTIEIVVTKNTQGVSVAVRNQGETISDEQQKHLFDRFYRADKSRQQVGTVGAGLGLSITQSIVRAYNGSIEVSSHNNITTFSLHFVE